jgi:glutaredoxin 3
MQINLNNDIKVEIWSQYNCPACEQAKALLDSRNINYTVKTLGEDVTKEHLYEILPNVRSVPQIFINNEHIGGLPELRNILR